MPMSRRVLGVIANHTAKLRRNMQYVPKHFTDKSTKNAESMSKVVPLQVKGEPMLKKQFEGKPLGNLL